MNTRVVDPRTLWAVLAMELAVALPLVSLPTQGDRLPGLLGPVLLVALLPLGFLAMHQLPKLRDPSWRLLIGLGLALLTRAVVSVVPAAGLPGLATWLARSLVPVAIGVGLWWRGGALSVAELTPAEVRTEFSVLAVCLLLVLAVVRPFVLADPTLLGASVAVFAVAGLVGMALSRQDAAAMVALSYGRALAATTAVLPAVSAVVLVSVLRPELLGAMWLTLARIIELMLMPIGLLLAWLASLLPRGAPGPPPTPPPRPTPDLLPDPAALAAAQESMAWLANLILFTLILAGAGAALLVARLLLQNWIGSPSRGTPHPVEVVVVERTGTPRADARDIFGWLLRWLRARFVRQRARALGRAGDVAENGVADSWAAYQRLLKWAERQGLGRRPAETTGQLQARLRAHAPQTANAVELLTSTYEWERYGAVHPPADRLRRIREAVRALTDG
jgi:Domain of unknown function (DUF4129)